MKQLPESIRNTKPESVNECQEWFGATADEIEKQEMQTSKQQIKSLINKIKKHEF